MSRYSANGFEWHARYPSLPVPSAIFPMQEAPGATAAVDSIAGRQLTVSGAITFGVSGEDGRTAARVDDLTSGLISTDADFPDLAVNGAFTVWARMRFPAAAGVAVTFGALSGSDPRYYITTNHGSGQFSFLIDDGPTSRSSGSAPAALGDHYDEWIDIIAVVDFDLDFVSVATPFSFGSVVLGAVVQATMAGVGPFHVFSSGPGGNATPNSECGYLAIWDDRALTPLEQAMILSAVSAPVSVPAVPPPASDAPVRPIELPSQWVGTDAVPLLEAIRSVGADLAAQVEVSKVAAQIETASFDRLRDLQLLVEPSGTSWARIFVRGLTSDGSSDLYSSDLVASRSYLAAHTRAALGSGSIYDLAETWRRATEYIGAPLMGVEIAAPGLIDFDFASIDPLGFDVVARVAVAVLSAGPVANMIA